MTEVKNHPVPNPITTESLRQKLIQVLPAALTSKSVFAGNGIAPVAAETDSLMWYGLGGPSLVGEGEKHTLSDLTVNEKDVYRAKLAYTLAITEEAAERGETDNMVKAALAQAVDSFAPGFDIVMISGTSPSTGIARPDLATIAIAANSKQHVFTEGADKFDVAIEAAMKDQGRGASYLALSDDGFNEYGFISLASGMPKYPLADPTKSFNHRWVNVATGAQVGQKAWKADGTIVENNVLGVLMDPTQIVRGLDFVKVKTTDVGSIGGNNAWEEDMVFYKITVGIRFAIKDVSKITTITAAGV